MVRKLTAWRRREDIDAELQEEMQTHLEMKASGDGRSARRAAAVWEYNAAPGRLASSLGMAATGGVAARLSICGADGGPETGFAATVVLTLALGIGASSTIFSLIDTVLIRPLPYPESDRLVAVYEARLADGAQPHSRLARAGWKTGIVSAIPSMQLPAAMTTP